jgi:hypothetical protein
MAWRLITSSALAKGNVIMSDCPTVQASSRDTWPDWLNETVSAMGWLTITTRLARFISFRLKCVKSRTAQWGSRLAASSLESFFEFA